MSDSITRLNAALEDRYRIEREVGEGGMATVYLAHDLKHERKVALKVLKPELAAVVGAERFLAEIKTTANLQHPHILPLHDSGEADRFLYYVMPYIEGESLRERLEREKQLPVDEAVRIATDVAEALHSAHKQGVIHRDIKPANILMSEGRPLVADFGIALAVAQAGGGRLTETGLSMGTPYYMSPEQASADREPTPASDVYSLGCVLYEMLVGEPPYGGSSAQAVLAKILMGETPAATETRPSIPANVDAAMRKALEKLPADRFPDAQGFARALANPGFRHGELVKGLVAADSASWTRLTTAFAATTLLASGIAAYAFMRPPAPLPVERFESPFAEGQEPTFFEQFAFNLSPDGSFLVYRGPGGAAGNQLWIRRWNALDAEPIRGTENGVQPSISPDQRELAFRQGGEIKVVAFDGGPVRTVTTGSWPRWGPDGYLYAAAEGGVVRVPSAGGAPEPVTQMGDSEISHILSFVFPSGEAAVVQVGLSTAPDDEIRVLRFDSGEMQTIAFGSTARFVETGHLLFHAPDGSLMAASIDQGSLTMGSPVPVVANVGAYAVAEAGRLVYSRDFGGGFAEGSYTPVWVDRVGQAREVDPGWVMQGQAQFSSVALSPDGARLVVSFEGAEGFDLWVKELDTGPLSRLTTVGGINRRATWSPDGASLLFQSHRDDRIALWTLRADGSSEAQLVLDDERGIFQGEYAQDGEWLVYRVDTNSRVGGNPDVYAIRPEVDSAPRALLSSEFLEWEATLSPDGQWLAYTSDRSGLWEVEVRPFPDVDSARFPVSRNGGREPLWSRDGSELFFRDGDNDLVSARFSVEGGSFEVTELTPLFSLDDYLSSAGGFRMYDVTRDGQSFLMLRAMDVSTTPSLILVSNFAEELKRLVPNE